ncbi:hypothetical protein GQ600_13619 [Phytophthora cactorum]|nr:hypothetical protein GQ600_13619 [Phytophthora cactorum]
MCTRARTPRPVDPGDAELTRAAQGVRETYGVMIEDRGGCNEARTDHDGSAAADPATSETPPEPASSPRDARPASSSDPSASPRVTPERGRRFARPTRRSLASTESSMASSLLTQEEILQLHWNLSRLCRITTSCKLQALGVYEGNTFGTYQGQEQGAPAAASVRAGQATHPPQQLDEWREKSTQSKRRPRACDVCSLLRVGGKRATTTSFFCGECSETGPIFLCMKTRRQI